MAMENQPSTDVNQVLDKVDVTLSLVLGETVMPIHQLLRIGRGAVIALDRSDGDQHILLAEDLQVGLGSVEVDNDTIACRINTFTPKIGRALVDKALAEHLAKVQGDTAIGEQTQEEVETSDA